MRLLRAISELYQGRAAHLHTECRTAERAIALTIRTPTLPCDLSARRTAGSVGAATSQHAAESAGRAAGPRSMRSMRQVMLLAGVLTGLLAGCGVAPRTVVVDRSPTDRPAQRPAQQIEAGRVHVVQRGDTLYSIAFRHGLEYRQVAAWNGIQMPYTIYPGQRIRLSPAGAQVAQRPPASAPAPSTQPGSPAPVAGSPASGTGTSSTAPNPSTAPAPVPAPVVVIPPAAPGNTPVTPSPAPPPTTQAGAPRWQWPTAGQVVGRFVSGDPTRQGLSIAGSAGQSVNAAADGVVVYSGSGLIGYGELVIVKHNEEFLSAYGHNRKRLVGEGEQVRAGQQIAEMGRSGAARDMLHFEIRRNGRPVDPSGFLPAR